MAPTTIATTQAPGPVKLESDIIPKAVITLIMLCGACIFAILIAKLTDWCYERQDIRDDASDISENTRQILKTNLELMRFGKLPDSKKPGEEETPEERAAHEEETVSHVAGIWSTKVLAKARLSLVPETGSEAGGSALPIATDLDVNSSAGHDGYIVGDVTGTADTGTGRTTKASSVVSLIGVKPTLIPTTSPGKVMETIQQISDDENDMECVMADIPAARSMQAMRQQLAKGHSDITPVGVTSKSTPR